MYSRYSGATWRRSESWSDEQVAPLQSQRYSGKLFLLGCSQASIGSAAARIAKADLRRDLERLCRNQLVSGLASGNGYGFVTRALSRRTDGLPSSG
jgi:hypothetical protein